MKTRQDKFEAARREVGFRGRVYERRVAEGKMSREDAEHEIACMREIMLDYQAPDLISESALVDRVAGALYVEEARDGVPPSVMATRQALVRAGPSDELNAALVPYRERAKAAIRAVRGD